MISIHVTWKWGLYKLKVLGDSNIVYHSGILWNEGWLLQPGAKKRKTSFDYIKMFVEMPNKL